jgi:Cof subfamily protein (haloacid dehalogenase superfamily)
MTGTDSTGAGDIRLLLSDVDGTLVTNDKVLTPAAIAAAQALREAGIQLALTSSRPAYGMRMLVAPLGLTQPMAGCNGGSLVNPDLSVIETHLIDPDAARETVAFLKGQGLDVWLYTQTDWFVPAPAGPHVERETFILQCEPSVATDFTEAQLSDAVKIVGVSDDFPRVAAGEAAAAAALGQTVSATRSANHFLDVTNPFANKGNVVHTLARRLNIAPAQIATIGDMPNDVLMFAQGGLSMGNASDAVKAKAAAVTDSNQDDGWAKAVRRFILPAAPA